MCSVDAYVRLNQITATSMTAVAIILIGIAISPVLIPGITTPS